MTSHPKSHDTAIPKTDPRSDKEGCQQFELSKSGTQLESDISRIETSPRKEAAMKTASKQARNIAQLQFTLDNGAAIELQRKYVERVSRALDNSMAPLYNQIDYSAALRSVHAAMEQVAKVVKAATEKIELSGIVNAFKPIAIKLNRMSVLTKTQWPMYLVDNPKACDEIDSLPDDEPDEVLKSRVDQIAFECLDEQWLDETRAIWESHEEISKGEMRLLVSALERHRKQDYEGSVSLLMNIFEGLIVKYAPDGKALNEEQEEVFDKFAKRHRVDSLYSEGKRRKLRNIKDKVLLMLVTSENGWLTFDSAINYLIDITLINSMDNALAAHNPLRNQICHGKQTEFDTLEHSLKAILVTDLIIRYGGALLEGQSIETVIIKS